MSTSAVTSLMHAVQALAQPAKVQADLYPPFVCAVDEMALELDDALRLFRSAPIPLSDRQSTAIVELDRYTDELSGEQNRELWTDPGELYTDARWEQIRILARAVLASFDWAAESPSKNGATYVAEHGSVKNE